MLEEMGKSFSRQDWPNLQRTSHSLKGLAANFSAQRVQKVLQEIESMSARQ